MGERTGQSPFRVALAARDLRLLLASLGLSTTGDWFYSVALVVFVFERTHSATWVAAATIARLVPFVAFGSLAGDLADRVDRKRLVIRADVTRAALMAAFSVAVSMDASPWVALAFAFAVSTAGTPYVPAITAMTPSLVPEHTLAAANALTASTSYMALVVGPAFGAVMMAFTSPRLAFAANAACFALSAIAVSRMETRPLRRPPAPEAGIVSRTLEGFRPIMRSGETAVLAGFCVGQAFLFGIEGVLLVLAAETIFEMGAVGYGWLLTAIGVGGLVAARFAGRLSELRRPTVVLVGSVIAVGLPIALLAVIREPWLAYPVLLFDGAGTLVTEVLAVTALQRSLREQEIGKVFAAVDAVAFGAVLLGSFLAPTLVEAYGLRSALVIGGLSAPVIAVLLSPVLRNVDRKAQERIRALAPTVRVLARSPIFRGASSAALEMLAGTLTGSRVRAGDIVIRRGEDAEDFFVVVDGKLEVTHGEEEGFLVASLGSGDHFGEIGILEACTRTATVRAVTDAKLFRIRSEDFLGVINKSPTVLVAMTDVAAGRLRRGRQPAAESDASAAFDPAGGT
jgi:MFS family permease